MRSTMMWRLGFEPLTSRSRGRHSPIWANWHWHWWQSVTLPSLVITFTIIFLRKNVLESTLLLIVIQHLGLHQSNAEEEEIWGSVSERRRRQAKLLATFEQITDSMAIHVLVQLFVKSYVIQLNWFIYKWWKFDTYMCTHTVSFLFRRYMYTDCLFNYWFWYFSEWN
jgi:hypothetical protein